MKMRISKVLEGAMAQATFDVSKSEKMCWLKDCLMLQILGAENSRAYRTLSSQLEGWQIRQLRLRLERFAYHTGQHTASPEVYYKRYAELLTEQFADAERVHTEHALIDILSDRTTLSSRLFALYGVTAESIKS
jgi:hypothetical protein